jgi:hypothetical protein
MQAAELRRELETAGLSLECSEEDLIFGEDRELELDPVDVLVAVKACGCKEVLLWLCSICRLVKGRLLNSGPCMILVVWLLQFYSPSWDTCGKLLLPTEAAGDYIVLSAAVQRVRKVFQELQLSRVEISVTAWGEPFCTPIIFIVSRAPKTEHCK